MWVLIKKELLHILRDKGLLIFIIYAFTLDIFLAAKGFQLIPENVSIAVFDEDHSSESRDLISRLKPPAFGSPRLINDRAEINRMMNNSEVVLALIIPSDFQKQLYRGSATVQVLVDGTQSSAAYLSSAYLTRVLNDYSFEIVRRQAWREGVRLYHPLELKSRIFFNPEARDDIYEGLNEFFMVITLIGMILPAALLIREREYGTIEQILISPLSIRRLILVKMAGGMIFLLTVIGLSYIFVLRLWLDFPLKAGLLEFLLTSFIYTISTTGLAFIIASIARRFSQIGMLTIVIFAPMLLLSGGWVPPEALPDWLRAATRVSPLKQFMDIGLSILIRGADMELLIPKMLKLILIGGILMGAGVLLYRRRVLRY